MIDDNDDNDDDDDNDNDDAEDEGNMMVMKMTIMMATYFIIMTWTISFKKLRWDLEDHHDNESLMRESHGTKLIYISVQVHSPVLHTAALSASTKMQLENIFFVWKFKYHSLTHLQHHNAGIHPGRLT